MAHQRVSIVGIGVSPGIAIGPAFVLEKTDYTAHRWEIPPGDVARELRRFRAAVAASVSQLRTFKRRLARDLGPQHVYILDAHLLMLKDRMLLDGVAKIIRSERVNAEWALQQVIARFREAFESIEDAYLREKAGDMEDIGQRVLHNLVGATHEQVTQIPEGVIVLARDLSPSDTAQMRKEWVLGFAIDMGGKTSHTAIVARSLEIPAVVGLEDITTRVANGDPLIIDGNTGQVYVHPDEETVRHYETLRRRYHRYDVELHKLRELPAETLDGYRVGLEANIELPEEIPSVLEHGAAGIGLYRTEFIYFNRDRHADRGGALRPLPAPDRVDPPAPGDHPHLRPRRRQVHLAGPAGQGDEPRARPARHPLLPARGHGVQDPARGHPAGERARQAAGHVPDGLRAHRAAAGEGDPRRGRARAGAARGALRPATWRSA